MGDDEKEQRRKKSLLKSSQGASLKDLPNIEQLQREASAPHSSPDRSPPKPRSSSPSLPDRADHPASPVQQHRDETRSPSPSVHHHHHHKDKGEKKDKDHHHNHRGKSPGVEPSATEFSRSASTLPNVVPPTLQVTKSAGVLPDLVRPDSSKSNPPGGDLKPHISRPPPTDDDDHAHPTAPPPGPASPGKAPNPLKFSMDSRLPTKEVGPEDFKKLKLLGRGDVGKVYLVQSKETGQYFAMKVLSKQEMIQRNKVKRAMTEREILATTNHPFIVTLYHSFMSLENLYFVMEYCAGGEFFRTLSKQPGRCLPEETAKFYAAEVLLALEYLHSMGFIYRDLKPENILLHETGHIMLTDFDLSKSAASTVQPKMVKNMIVSAGKGKTPTLVNKPDIVTNSFVGTEEYIAPEVIEGFGHTSTVDWWTFGILLYEMLVGVTPFRGRNRDDTFNQIMHAGIKFPEKPEVSKDAKALLKALLNPDPKNRLGGKHGAPDVKAHKWFKNLNWALIRNMAPPIKPKISGPLDTSNFRKIEDPSLLEEDHALSSQQIEEITHDPSNPFHDFKPLTKPHAPSPVVPHHGATPASPTTNPMSVSMGATVGISPRKSAPGSKDAGSAPSLLRSSSAHTDTHIVPPGSGLRSSSVHEVNTGPGGKSDTEDGKKSLGLSVKSDTEDGKKPITSGSDSAAESARRDSKKEKKEHHHHHHHKKDSTSDSDSDDDKKEKTKKEKHHHHHLRKDLLSGSEPPTSDTDDNEHKERRRREKKEKKDKRRELTSASGSEAMESDTGDGKKREERRTRKASIVPNPAYAASSGDEAGKLRAQDRIDPPRDATESPAPVPFRKVPSITVEEGAMLDVKKEKTEDDGQRKKHHEEGDKKKSKKRDESSSTE